MMVTLGEEGMKFDSALEEKIFSALLASGWRREDVLFHQRISWQGRLVEVDIVLLYNIFPLAFIEVKAPVYDLLAENWKVTDAIDMFGTPFLFVTNGVEIIKINSQKNVSQIKVFPTPQELLGELGKNSDKNDPVFFEPPNFEGSNIRFHQAIAITNTVEKLKSQKRVSLIMPVGSGKTRVVTQIIWKLIQSNFYKKVLIVCDRVVVVSELEKQLHAFGEELLVVSHSELEQPELLATKRIIITSNPKILETKDITVFSQWRDLVVLYGEFNSKFLESLSVTFQDASVLVVSSTERPFLPLSDFEASFQYSVEDIVSAEDVRIPDGYKSIPLEDVAEIILGHGVSRKTISEGEEGLFLTGRALMDDGQINFDETKTLVLDSRRKPAKIQPNDIIVAAISSSRIRVGLVPPDFTKDLYVSNSLILIRVNLLVAKPKDVFDYFSSPDGYANVLRYAGALGTSVYRISASQLAKTPILIPDIQRDSSSQKPLELSLLAQAKETLEKDILPLFQDLSNDEENGEIQEPQIEYIAEKLRSVALKLSPPKIKDKILKQYPMPIAVAYRRFLDSKFNAYEQILRLRDVFESAGFFIYNIMLADLLRNLDVDKYKIKEAGSRRAYNGYSMAKRVDFLGEIFEIASQDGNKDDLFTPEILEVNMMSKLREMGEFRNLISHTAAATERRQKMLINKYRPIVEGILESMEFITSYRLVRIPEFKFSNNRLIRRMEVYSGVVPEIEEYPLPDESEIIKAESDHLVLLNQEDEFLDLFPLYQLFASEETYDEAHICFLKQRKAEPKKLIGESVQGAREVFLDGYDVFEELQSKVK